MNTFKNKLSIWVDAWYSHKLRTAKWSPPPPRLAMNRKFKQQWPKIHKYQQYEQQPLTSNHWTKQWPWHVAIEI